MRIILPHHKPRTELIEIIDRSVSDLFKPSATLPFQFVVQQRSWQGSTLTFSLLAKMGFVSAPIKGTIEVSDTEITIDVDLGMLEKLIPADQARNLIGSRVRGLLK
jgi:hypothetical protein